MHTVWKKHSMVIILVLLIPCLICMSPLRTQADDAEYRFIDNQDGTVTDSQTGKMWLQNPGNVLELWEDAQEYCTALEFAGYDNWQLPSKQDFETLTDQTTGSPLLPKGHPFQFESRWYWTSTEIDAGRAWGIRIGYGGSLGGIEKDLDTYVWPVRDVTP